MDVPLFIRVLEYAREDAQADMDLHDLAEKAIAATKQQGLLQMDDYDMLIGDLKQLAEASKGALNYFNDLKYYYQKAFRYLDVEEREEYKQLAKDFFSNLQIDDKVRAVGLEEGAVEIMDSYNRILDLLKKESRALNDDDSYALGLKLRAWFEKNIIKENMSLDDQAKAYYLAKVKRGEIDTLPEDPKAAFLAQMTKDQITHDKETLRRERGLEEKAAYIAETIKLGMMVNEELCEKGKRYIKARQAAGEKSSAYLSGRAVRVCKGQIEWPKKEKKKKTNESLVNEGQKINHNIDNLLNKIKKDFNIDNEQIQPDKTSSR